ncbi:MAG TPA: CRISPR-associated protein Cas5 [Candidatus Marinimicrobia bacterium]|nr:CRISPR-associated protein Cas5 [Candidatus Neomarinimicrobiota bacterium]
MTSYSQAVSFRLSGSVAHFRKFYTNASAMSYGIPPRTVISGMMASILEIPRDGYYQLFSPDHISVAVRVNQPFKRVMQSINNLSEKYYELLIGKNGNPQHKATKVELLTGINKKAFSWDVILAFPKAEKHWETLVEKILSGDMGYGLYFGQRQYRANLDNVQILKPETWIFHQEGPFCDWAFRREQAHSYQVLPPLHIEMDIIPRQMKTDTKGRLLESSDYFVYEQNGHRINGQFFQVWETEYGNVTFI